MKHELNKNSNFVNDVICGKAAIADLDDYVDFWHTHDTGDVGLPEFLGLTESEYSVWLFSSDEGFFEGIVTRRVAGTPAQCGKEVPSDGLE